MFSDGGPAQDGYQRFWVLMKSALPDPGLASPAEGLDRGGNGLVTGLKAGLGEVKGSTGAGPWFPPEVGGC